MKMAKASEADIEMAMTLCRYLDDIERGYMPGDLSPDSELSEWLDERDCDQYARLLDGMRELLNRGSIMRVVWGMAVVCDPANKCIDPDADTIEHHPELIRAMEQRDELLAALKRLSFAAECRDNTTGDPIRLIAVRAELAAAAEFSRAVISSAEQVGVGGAVE